jgi:murein DD-endopeptidase MepM/ murein hydrolase activator NlpD
MDEAGKTFYSFYAHMKNDSIKVVTGQKVQLGQVLGEQGSTGNSTGEHLHFEIRLEDKTKVDPAPYLFEEVMII